MQPGDCGEQRCPEFCLCMESFFCTSCAVSSSRQAPARHRVVADQNAVMLNGNVSRAELLGAERAANAISQSAKTFLRNAGPPFSRGSLRLSVPFNTDGALGFPSHTTPPLLSIFFCVRIDSSLPFARCLGLLFHRSPSPRRMYLMDKFQVRPDPWDNRIIVS